MTDSFALLDEPRRPWIEVAALKAKFMQLSAAAHPDRIHDAAEADRETATRLYTELNAAWRCLSEPKDRLFHLLELELGHKPSGLQQTPADALELFMQVGRLCREADQFLAEQARAASPMLKVQRFERGLDWTDQLLNLQGSIRSKQNELEAQLRSLNQEWADAPAVGDPARRAGLPLARLEELYRFSSYLARWHGQVQERVVQLSL
jgi:DnaJ-domain-containing protein 1